MFNSYDNACFNKTMFTNRLNMGEKTDGWTGKKKTLPGAAVCKDVSSGIFNDLVSQLFLFKRLLLCPNSLGNILPRLFNDIRKFIQCFSKLLYRN